MMLIDAEVFSLLRLKNIMTGAIGNYVTYVKAFRFELSMKLQ